MSVIPNSKQRGCLSSERRMRNMKCLIILFVAICIASSVEAQYRASVVEFSPFSEATPNATVERNIEEYIHYIETARNNNVQIIVFPEYGLTGLVDDPTPYAIEIPVLNNGTNFTNYWLQKLSNAAREHSLYVVVNLLEKARNENNDTIYYNINLVFDRTGQIISKYRKINLFLEPNITPGNEIVTFTTDFGVTFGIFTCADILYHHPSRTILANGSISDIIFPTAWTSTLPFYHSLSIQSGYSQANQVNLLAADYNNPSQGLGGSGIYRHDGTIDTYYISGLPSTQLLTSDLYARGVPRDEGNAFVPFGFDILNNTQSDLRNFISARDFQASNYVFRQLQLSPNDVQENICHGKFCCSFTISAIDIVASEVYQLLVYNGPTKIGDSQGNIRHCSVVSCQSSDLNTCGIRNLTLQTKFSKITINGTFEAEEGHFYVPATLRTNLLPVFNTSFSSEITNSTAAVSITSTRTVENLVVFGILGRGGAPLFGSSILFIIIVSLLKAIFEHLII